MKCSSWYYYHELKHTQCQKKETCFAVNISSWYYYHELKHTQCQKKETCFAVNISSWYYYHELKNTQCQKKETCFAVNISFGQQLFELLNYLAVGGFLYRLLFFNPRDYAKQVFYCYFLIFRFHNWKCMVNNIKQTTCLLPVLKFEFNGMASFHF